MRFSRLASRLTRLAPLAAIFLPLVAVAQATTVSQVAGIFNIFVGLMLTVAMLTYFTGFGMWIARLGTWPSYRTQAVKIMEWSVAVLFVLVVLLMIVQFFQKHTQAALWVLSAIVIIGIGWFIFTIMLQSGKGHGHDEEE